MFIVVNKYVLQGICTFSAEYELVQLVTLQLVLHEVIFNVVFLVAAVEIGGLLQH